MKSSYKILQESLNVDTLIVNLRSRFDRFKDKRGKNSSVSLTDILMSAYAIFSLKYSSLLQFEMQNPGVESPFGPNLNQPQKLGLINSICVRINDILIYEMVK